jgi:hypothetical protein
VLLSDLVSGGESVVVYPREWWSIAMVAFACPCLLAVLGLFGWVFVDPDPSVPAETSVLVVLSVVLVFCVISLGVGLAHARGSLRMLGALPLARFDRDGFESALGRVRWSDIERIGVVLYEHPNDGADPSKRLLARPRSGSAVGTGLSRYAAAQSGGLPVARRTPHGELELCLWTTSSRVLRTVRRFYEGPIATEVERRPADWS